MTATERFDIVDYNAGYAFGISIGPSCYHSTKSWERGLLAARIALWCGVSLWAQ